MSFSDSLEKLESLYPKLSEVLIHLNKTINAMEVVPDVILDQTSELIASIKKQKKKCSNIYEQLVMEPFSDGMTLNEIKSRVKQFQEEQHVSQLLLRVQDLNMCLKNVYASDDKRKAELSKIQKTIFDISSSRTLPADAESLIENSELFFQLVESIHKDPNIKLDEEMISKIENAFSSELAMGFYLKSFVLTDGNVTAESTQEDKKGERDKLSKTKVDASSSKNKGSKNKENDVSKKKTTSEDTTKQVIDKSLDVKEKLKQLTSGPFSDEYKLNEMRKLNNIGDSNEQEELSDILTRRLARRRTKPRTEVEKNKQDVSSDNTNIVANEVSENSSIKEEHSLENALSEADPNETNDDEPDIIEREAIQTNNPKPTDINNKQNDNKLRQPESFNRAREIAQYIVDEALNPTNVEYYDACVKLLILEMMLPSDNVSDEHKLAQALMLLNCCSMIDEPEAKHYLTRCNQLSMATDTGLFNQKYDSDSLFTSFPAGETNNSEYLMALMRTLFAPDTQYDHALSQLAKSLFERFDEQFGKFSYLKNLYHSLLNLNEQTSTGFSPSLLRSFSDKDEEKKLFSNMSSAANNYLQLPTISGRIKALMPMKEICFGKDSDLYFCMNIILKNTPSKEERELVKSTLERFCELDGEKIGSISAKKIEDEFARNWSLAIQRIKGPDLLTSHPKQKLLNNYMDRLQLIQRWLELTESAAESTASKAIFGYRDEILKELNYTLSVLDASEPDYDKAIFILMLSKLKRRLQGELFVDSKEHGDLLRSGFFSLEGEDIMRIESLFSNEAYYEPWRHAVNHIISPHLTLNQVLDGITNSENEVLFDNLGQAISIVHFLKNTGADAKDALAYKSDISGAEASMQRDINTFVDELENAFALGMIDEAAYEQKRERIELFKDYFFERHNYGSMRQYLRALKKQVEELADSRRQQLLTDIDERSKKASENTQLSALLDAARERITSPAQNFVVAEEYLNRFDSNQTGLLLAADQQELSAFEYFVSDDVFKPMYEHCRTIKNSRRPFVPNAIQYISDILDKSQAQHDAIDNAHKLLSLVPQNAEKANAPDITALLKEIGIDALDAKKEKTDHDSTTFSRWKVTARPDAKNRVDYSHPVDILGTKLRSPLDVIFLAGNSIATDIVDRICGLGIKSTSIVFFCGPIDLAGRRSIAEYFYDLKSGTNPFLLIDWVLLIHLALSRKNERLSIMLNCTLPFSSSYKPYVANGSVSDEMFIGRKAELSQILDPNGPVMLYGGRQLGKTALLERALNRKINVEKKEYSVLIRALNISSEEVLTQRIAESLNDLGFSIDLMCSIEDLCSSLLALYRDGIWSSLLILIDEADALLESLQLSTPAYSALTAFVNLRRDTGNDFKFVFAGLHNVYRAANEPNSILGQLGEPLCIKPLAAIDAFELLAHPLRFMGFSLDPDQLVHLLVNASFYPGIIHVIGKEILQLLHTRYREYFKSTHNPPYKLTQSIVDSVIGTANLNQKINDRIRLTLNVDPKYHMLARSIAYLYHDIPSDMQLGYSAELVHEYAQLLNISCLENLSTEAVTLLMFELVDMGILVETSTNHFRLRQRRFLDTIGRSVEAIEQDIIIAQSGISND